MDDKEVRFFTTRPDTVFGVSFMVLAPEHPLVAEITTDAQRAKVESYAAEARRQTEIERMSTVKEKTGVFTGAYVRNVFTGKDIPIWIADYVLMGYGTGAIMAAPGGGSARFRIRKKVWLADSPRDRTRRRHGSSSGSRIQRPRHRDQLGLPQRQNHPRGDRCGMPVRRAARNRPRDHQLPDARLAHLASALLGMPDPDRVLQ